MKSQWHAGPYSNPITWNIYGLPDLVERKGTYKKSIKGHPSQRTPQQHLALFYCLLSFPDVFSLMRQYKITYPN